MKKFPPHIFILIVVFIFFWQFILKGFLPIPSDTIIGFYHPFRDFYAKDYPQGIPFKNYLITDPVRQQYPWRNLAISLEKKFQLPLWNPYSFSGTPLLANFQSAVFYPLNLLFFIFPFSLGWSILILFESLLSGLFLYFYLTNLRLNKWASFLGALALPFSGFSIAWLEWNTVLQTALWLPLVLLSIDKIFANFKETSNRKYKIANIYIKNKKLFIWSLIPLFSLISSFFAGHLQTFFYLFMTSFVYLIMRWFQYGKVFKILYVFFIFYILFFIFTSIQWLTTFQFILLSARNVDQLPWQNPGWFIPWQNLVQFIAPDFFGNPTTLNYWGVWNYGEFVGYIGIAPIIMALFALFFRRDKKTLFFGTLFFLSLIFSLPTIFAKFPFIFKIPFVDTAQPTRLLFITDFSLAILASFGFDYFLKTKNKKEILYPLGFIAIIFLSLIVFAYLAPIKLISQENLSIAKHNLILPAVIFLITAILFFIVAFIRRINKNTTIMIYIIIVGITVFDLLRFGFKFTPFTKEDYLFPQTKILSFLQKGSGNYRVMSTDSRILPPNFSIMYEIQSIDGYDPLYLQRYAELIAASERKEPNIKPPFGFNRIITPHNYSSKIIDLLGVKYLLSLSDINSNKVKKIIQEGETRIYENREVLSRVFFVQNVQIVIGKDEVIKKMFNQNFSLRDTAVVESSASVNTNLPQGCIKCEASISYYGANKIVIRTDNQNKGFLVLTDTFYPTWKAMIDGKATKIYLTDYNFRGIVVPAGKHEIVFYDSLL